MMVKRSILRHKMLIGWTFFFLFLLGVFAFVIGSNFTAKASEAENLVSNQADLVPFIAPVTISDIKMSVIDMHQEGKYFQVDVCHSLPDDRDWGLTSRPDDAVLTVEGQPYAIWEEGLLDLKFNSDGVAHEKCHYLLFPVKVKNGANLALTLKKIYVSEPEKVDCPSLQKQLDERNSNIEVVCPTEPGVGGFGITAKPESMDTTTALEYAQDILTDARKGPWIFRFKFSQP